jgi:hypothetical protein
MEGGSTWDHQDAASEALANQGNGVPPTIGGSRGPRLPVDPEHDIARLKSRLRKNGADGEAVDFCDDVFKDGVSTGALEKRLTREECTTLGVQDGKKFQRFLEKVTVSGGTKNRWRLCRGDAVLYKNHRDALRHFLKDHFGLWFGCNHW